MPERVNIERIRRSLQKHYRTGRGIDNVAEFSRIARREDPGRTRIRARIRGRADSEPRFDTPDPAIEN